MERTSVNKAKPPTASSPLRSGVFQRSPGLPGRSLSVPPIVHEVLRSPGRPLDAATRADMEPRFGHDFSQVRVHADARAAEAASSIGARAYTSGRHIVFGAGQNAPEAAYGRQILAHELTHVVQQGSGIQIPHGVSEPGHPLEDKADTVARLVNEGRSAAPHLTGLRENSGGARGSGDVIQRKPAEVTPEDREKVAAPAGNAAAGLPSVVVGDVVARAGTFSGKNPLTQIIHEDYNHSGVALDASSVHHVESKGYETVSLATFLAPENASGGAVMRFQGPFADRITARVADIAKQGRYKKIPGNPFSTAEDLKTVNCNEFTHELYRQAIAETISNAKTDDPSGAQQMVAEYTPLGKPAEVSDLIAPKNLEISTGMDVVGTKAFVGAAQTAGSQSLDKGAAARKEVRVEFEGKIERRNLYPDEWATS